jgi:hypothetical protein
MENQYCRVGSTNEAVGGIESVEWLELQYRHFLEKAVEAQKSQNKFRDFFERKALQLEQQLQKLMHA